MNSRTQAHSTRCRSLLAGIRAPNGPPRRRGAGAGRRAGPPNWPGGDDAWREFRSKEPVNAHSHLIAFVLGTSESVPIHRGAIQIGTYQNIIVVRDPPHSSHPGRPVAPLPPVPSHPIAMPFPPPHPCTLSAARPTPSDWCKLLGGSGGGRAGVRVRACAQGEGGRGGVKLRP